jgi:hypothetical protein
LKDVFNIQSAFISTKNFYPNRNIPYMCIPNQLQTFMTEGKRPFWKHGICEDYAAMDIVFWM